MDDQLDAITHSQLARWRIAGRQIVIASSVGEGMNRLSEGAIDGVIAALRDPTESLAFLRRIKGIDPAVQCFLRADSEEMNAKEASQWCVFPRAWSRSMADDTISRSFALARWESNHSLVEVMGHLRSIPTVPVLYSQITEALQKDDCPAEEIGRLISKEPAITAKLLQCVNASQMGLSRKISNPQEGVMFLGTKKIRALVLLSSIFVRFDGSKCAQFNLNGFFKDSLNIASWASGITLNETHDKGLADMSFTAGLLHEFGVLLLAANLPESYGQVLQSARERRVGIDRVELENYGATHADIGGFILARWGLPFPIMSAVAWHHTPYRSIDTKFSPLTAVHIANAVNGYVYSKNLAYDREYAERLGFTEAKVDHLAQSLLGENLYW